MNNDFDQIVEDDTDFQIDAELYELRKKFMNLKEQRKKASMECSTLENKVKVLSLDDQKISKKIENEKKSKEFKEIMHSKLLQEKERILNNKKNIENDLKLKKAQIEVMRQNIKNISTNWKNNLYEVNKSEVKKFKMVKEENNKFINLIKQEEEDKNKQQCTIVKTQIIQSLERRKQLEQEKKLKMKQQLEAKINEELNLKNIYDEKIGSLEEQEKNLDDKKKKTLSEFSKISKIIIKFRW